MAALTGPHSDPLRDGFQATSLDQNEVQLTTVAFLDDLLLAALKSEGGIRKVQEQS